MDDELISITDFIDDDLVLVNPDTGKTYTYSKESNTLSLQEDNPLLEEGVTDNDPIVAVDTNYDSIIESIEGLRTDLVDLTNRSNEIVGAILIVLIAHVTLMIFRKIFGMAN